MTERPTFASGSNVTDEDQALDVIADYAKRMRRDEERAARLCLYCGQALADPDAGRAIVVEQDGMTTVFHADCGEPWQTLAFSWHCAQCRREIRFHGAAGRTRTYCSPACRKRAHHALTERVEPPLARTCPGCGEWFTPRRDDQRTCSPRCRQRVHRHGDQHPVTFAQHEPSAPTLDIDDDLGDLDLGGDRA